MKEYLLKILDKSVIDISKLYNRIRKDGYASITCGTTLMMLGLYLLVFMESFLIFPWIENKILVGIIVFIDILIVWILSDKYMKVRGNALSNAVGYNEKITIGNYMFRIAIFCLIISTLSIIITDYLRYGEVDW